MFLECRTFRHRGHYEGENPHYWDPDERQRWLDNDPVSGAGAAPGAGEVPEEERPCSRRGSMARIDEAVAFAEASPLPDPTDALQDVFAEGPPMTEMTFAAAIRPRCGGDGGDPGMFIIGEDIGRYGGEMGATAGLYDRFGEERVRDAPISETAIVGCALGVAMTGNRAIAEIPFGDFLGMCMDQVYNQAAKVRYMSGGQVRVPLVIRTTMGGYMSAAEQHSQCLESWFVHAPGIKVVVPSTPADAAGLLRAAIRDENPVLFFEHKGLYGLKGEVPDDPEWTVPLGCRLGGRATDVTVVATGMEVHKALEAATAAGGGGHQRRGHRPPDARPARRGHHPRVGRAGPAMWSSYTRHGSAVGMGVRSLRSSRTGRGSSCAAR